MAKRRARDGLLLAIHFDAQRVRTLGLYEVVTQLENHAPPDGAGSASLFTSMFVHFVQPHALSNWDQALREEDNELAGTDADNALIGYAETYKLPLITNEGFTPDGIVNVGIRKKCGKRGVPVFAPHEYLAGKVDIAADGEAFLGRYFEAAKARLATIRDEKTWNIARHNFERVSAYYRFLLGLETT